jgi:sensory rhodopsin
LLKVHLTIWTLYPIVWLLSPAGLNFLNISVETMFVTLLDMASKVGFGFLSLQTMSAIEKARQQAKTASSLVVFR